MRNMQVRKKTHKYEVKIKSGRLKARLDLTEMKCNNWLKFNVRRNNWMQAECLTGMQVRQDITDIGNKIVFNCETPTPSIAKNIQCWLQVK